MKILFISDNYYPETNAPAQRTTFHCEHWRTKDQCEVEVVTCAPNFPTGKCFVNYENRLYQREIIGSVSIHRVWSYITKNEGVFKRFIDFLSFMISAIIMSHRYKQPDLVVATSPQFFTLIAGYVVARFKSAVFVIEIRDLWPDSIVAVGATSEGFIIRLFRRLERFLYQAADGIVVVSPAFVEHVKKEIDDKSKVVVVTNGVDKSRFSDLDVTMAKKKFNPNGKFLVTYIGTIGLAHGLETIIEAARTLQDDDNIHFVIAGDGAERDNICRLAENLKNVTILPPLHLDEVAVLHLATDLAIVHLKKSPVFEKVLPSKIFESFASKTPILIGVDGEARDLVEKFSAGIYFRPEDHKDLVDKLLTLYHQDELYTKLSANSDRATATFDRINLANEMFEHLRYFHNRKKH